MSNNLNTFLAQPFGDEVDPKGFWLLLLDHLEHLKVRNYAADTIRVRALYVRAFARWCLDRDLHQPALITKPLLESFQRHLYRLRKANGKPLSWSSQELHLTQVNQFFRYLVKRNHLPFNPASEIELPKQPQSLPSAILSEDEVERILAEPDTTTTLGLRDRAILETFYSCGIRRAELCRLRIDQLDVERRTIFINVTLHTATPPRPFTALTRAGKSYTSNPPRLTVTNPVEYVLKGGETDKRTPSWG